MRTLCRPARSMAARMASSFGGCENFTYTSVPPRKSTPSGIPCQKKIESKPATLKINEKAMKYHFLPRKSILGSRKNSTLLPTPSLHQFLDINVSLNAQRFSALLPAQHPVKN